MPRIQPSDDQLRAQIEAATAEHYSAKSIEDRIASSLLDEGRFEDSLGAEELAIILRNVVYFLFAEHKIGGRNVGLVHNIPTMDVKIENSQAQIHFIVHIHKPIVAFIKFGYTLVNDPVGVARGLRVKRGSLSIEEHTRRFDLKAKAALAAINVESIARQELAKPSAVIVASLPPQLLKLGAKGLLTDVELALRDRYLDVCLEGEFARTTSG